MNTLRLILATLLVASGPASAREFRQFQFDKSTLHFVSRQMGVAVDGRFRKFSATLAFDPARPAAATARLDVDLASVDAGSPDADDEVVGKPWFNVKLFPTASFVSTAIRPLGGDRFELVGKLTIKGKTQEVSAPFTFRQDGGYGVFDGAFVLKRLDFGVGDGVWSDVSTVANEVQIRFHIVASPTASGK
ncbi:YceI family protein [Candidatus Accumulibacter sp. ACC007]|uniref:YceI family protein n=1 Tax=Candidatus Accumulibacter sp. ACC007 TaxID=2823333 RepID=UPI0025C28757|nr:YceI family protein [Candidatus Accumulibacter sp. ACC007]